MLLTLLLKVEIEHTFVFPKIMFHTWEKVQRKRFDFSKSTLKTSSKHLIQNCYFMVGNSLIRQKIDIRVGIGKSLFIHV